mmetsp:Transcript_8524/g.12914  ORF Transcript_8524/g.12914 Transcript_8524/m.12914 type:complete len:120 (-) Transcript_8524:562-921(-)
MTSQWDGELLLVGPSGPTTDRLLNTFLEEGIKTHHFPFTEIIPTPTLAQFSPPYTISVFCSAHAVFSLSAAVKENGINFSDFGKLIGLSVFVCTLPCFNSFLFFISFLSTRTNNKKSPH